MAGQQQQGEQLRPALAPRSARLVKIDDHLHDAGDRRPARRDDLPGVEKGIASSLRERVQSNGRHDQRRRGAGHRHPAAGRHWASLAGGRSPRRPAQGPACRLRRPGRGGRLLRPAEPAQGRLRLPDAAAAMYRAYESELYRFDQLYRHFCEAADQAEAAGLGHPQAAAGRRRGALRQLVLPDAWPGLGQVRRAAGRPACCIKWQIDKVPNQHEFFERHVRPWLDEAENRRGLRHHQRCLPLRGGPGTDRGTQRQVPLRGHAVLAARRAAVVHGAGHGEPAAAQDARLQGERRRAGGRQADRVPEQRDDILQAVGRHGVQGRRPDGDEEGRGPGVRQGQAGRLHLPQHRRCGRATSARPRSRPSRRCGGPSTNWRRWSATSSTT